ncbi:MAG: PAS domain S-box protein [Bacillota bacterium]
MEKINYNNIIENMPLAFAYNKVTYYENNKISEFVILKTNKKFEEITGLKKSDVINQKGIKILENIINKPDEFIQLCGQVALDGQSRRFEGYSKLTDKYFEIKISSQKKGYFTIIFNDISGTKNTRNKLKNKTSIINNIFYNLNDIIWSMTWPDFQIQFISKKIKDIFGYSIKDFKEEPMLIQKITHPEDKHKNDKALKELREKGYAEREIRIISKDGSILWIYDKSKMIYDENNNPVKVEGVMRDITKRKMAENDLKYSHKMYKTVFNSAPIGIIIENKNGDILEVNKAECEMTGYTKDELEGSNIIDKFVLPQHHELAKSNIKNIIEGQDIELDIETPKKNGDIVYMHLKETNITFPDGTKGIISMHIDVTERKKKEDKIKKQRKRMENTIEATEAGTFEWNLQTGNAVFNEKWAEMIGYTLDEISPTSIDTWEKFLHPEDLKKCEKLLEEHFQGETDHYKVEIRMKHKEGHWIWVLSQGKVISWTNAGKPLKMFGTHLNVTDRKNRIKALKFQHDFQKTLANISSKLVGIDNGDFDNKVHNSLKEIGLFFEIDRSYIFQFSDDKKYVSNTYEWTAEGIDSEKENLQNLSVNFLPWLMEKLKKQEVVNVYNVEQLKEVAKKEKEIFLEEKIKSIVIMPIFIKDRLWGFFGFDSVKEKKNFNQEKIDKLKIITDVITNAFLQYLNINRIEKLTYKDILTGLYNRRFFEEEMDRLDTKRQLPISIIMADVNGLKIINDSYGHEVGDQMLIETAKILKEELRNEDLLARHGGDEFTILLPQTSKREAEKIISRLKEKNNKMSKNGITNSFSLGVATKVNEDENIRNVFKNADDEMYRNKLSESRSTKHKIVQNLLNTLEAKSSETKEHAIRMNKLARDLGNKIGLSISELNRLSILATLHDIGKTTISEEILTKPGELTKKEWEIIKEHPSNGYKIASASEEFIVVAEDILHHHECWDGSGYAGGLKGKEIPYLARIISIIDAYDVMTNERPYSEALSKKEALDEIRRCAGGQFDPELVKEFIELQENN